MPAPAPLPLRLLLHCPASGCCRCPRHAARARWPPFAPSDTISCDVQSVTWSHGATLSSATQSCPHAACHVLVWLQPAAPVPQIPPYIVGCRADSVIFFRKPPQPRAWQGTNPITQRPASMNTNGVVNPPRFGQSTALSAESGTPMRHLNDRMMYLLANLSVSCCSSPSPLQSETHITHSGPPRQHHLEKWRQVHWRSVGHLARPQ